MDLFVGVIAGAALTILLELLALDAFLAPFREFFAALLGV